MASGSFFLVWSGLLWSCPHRNEIHVVLTLSYRWEQLEAQCSWLPLQWGDPTSLACPLRQLLIAPSPERKCNWWHGSDTLRLSCRQQVRGILLSFKLISARSQRFLQRKTVRRMIWSTFISFSGDTTRTMPTPQLKVRSNSLCMKKWERGHSEWIIWSNRKCGAEHTNQLAIKAAEDQTTNSIRRNYRLSSSCFEKRRAPSICVMHGSDCPTLHHNHHTLCHGDFFVALTLLLHFFLLPWISRSTEHAYAYVPSCTHADTR